MDVGVGTHWPGEPYREFDFYTTTDEALFCDRSAEVEECIQLFSQYHTKVLLLHGSSGSGKSSFLRAGLIPHLKRVVDPPGYAFLQDHDGVIRCTNDPVRVVARQVLAATALAGRVLAEQSRPIRKLREETPLLSEESVASEPSSSLVEPLLNSLSLLRLIVGKTMVLVVDQAEEVLTHPRKKDCTDAFFQFIEEIYLRDFDVRLIISLRTEYYGRFRNPLRIRDRYRALPADGGLELYLLASLRDPVVLTHALDFPASNGQHNYGFSFAPGVLRMIVDDALATLPENASVTPALQVVCATLTRTRAPENPITVTAEHYRTLGGLGRIVDRTVDSALKAAADRSARRLRSARAAIGISDSLTDRWRSVLVEMVSEQGGGVVVAIPRSGADLERAARGHGLSGNIEPALRTMAEGRGAILRLMGTDADPAYILKHDTLAVRLWRWNQQQLGVRRLRRKAICAGGVGLAICAAVAVAFLFASFSNLAAHDANIRLRTNFAEHEPGGRPERSLMVLLANLAETRQHYDLADRLHRSSVHEESLAAMRRTLLRVPWFSGRFAAAGTNSNGTELALLDTGNNKVQLLILPDGAVDEHPWDHLRTLHIAQPTHDPAQPVERSSKVWMAFPSVVGFVSGLGATVVRDGQAYFWVGETVMSRQLAPRLPSFIDRGQTRFEIVGGAIQATRRNQREAGPLAQTVRLDRTALEPGEPIAPPPPVEYQATSMQAAPLFDNTTSIGRFARYDESNGQSEDPTSLPHDPTDNWSDAPGRSEPGALVVSVQTTNGSEVVHFPAIEVIRRQHDQTKPRLTVAFATGDETAVAFKSSGRSFYLRDWSSAPEKFGLPADRPRQVTVAGDTVGSDEDNRLLPAQWPFINPLFAVARTDRGWRAAWMVRNGIQAVETEPDFDGDILHDGRAHLILSGVLISNPTGGRLTFSRGGRFLVLEENVPDRRAVDVKVWDLGTPWQNLIKAETTDEAKLTQIACRAINESGSLRTDQLKLFDIAAEYSEPCKGVQP
jgi:hypothetical protein